MNMVFKLKWGLLLAGLVLALGWGQAFSQTLVPTTIAWNAPTTGSPAVEYVVQYSEDGGGWIGAGTSTTTSISLDLATGHSYRFRVAGVDSEDRRGDFSAPSPAYSPVAPTGPGQPGQPVLVGDP